MQVPPLRRAHDGGYTKKKFLRRFKRSAVRTFALGEVGADRGGRCGEARLGTRSEGAQTTAGRPFKRPVARNRPPNSPPLPPAPTATWAPAKAHIATHAGDETDRPR